MIFRHFHKNPDYDNRVNGRSGTVAIEVVDRSVRIGHAICSIKEKNFSRKQGRLIAQGRAAKQPFTKLDHVPTNKELMTMAQLHFEECVNELN